MGKMNSKNSKVFKLNNNDIKKVKTLNDKVYIIDQELKKMETNKVYEGNTINNFIAQYDVIGYVIGTVVGIAFSNWTISMTPTVIDPILNKYLKILISKNLKVHSDLKEIILNILLIT